MSLNKNNSENTTIEQAELLSNVRGEFVSNDRHQDDMQAKNGHRNANDGEIAKNLYQQGHKHKHQGRNIQHHGSPTNHLRRRNMEHEKKQMNI